MYGGPDRAFGQASPAFLRVRRASLPFVGDKLEMEINWIRFSGSFRREKSSHLAVQAGSSTSVSSSTIPQKRASKGLWVSARRLAILLGCATPARCSARERSGFLHLPGYAFCTPR